MHLAVQTHRFQELAPIGLERAAVVVQGQSQKTADDPVGDPRRDLACDHLVLAIAPPSRHHVVALVELGQQERDVGRIILQIGVHRNQHLTCRCPEPGGQRRSLAVVAPKPDDAKPRAFTGGLLELCETRVVRAVVDHDDLGGVPARRQIGHRLVEHADQPIDGLGFVVAGYDDGQLHGAQSKDSRTQHQFLQGQASLVSDNHHCARSMIAARSAPRLPGEPVNNSSG